MSRRIISLVIIHTFYQRPEGHWRGLCVPFDIVCEADTIEEVRRMLEESTSLYLEGLAEHDFPEHLMQIPLSNEDDQKHFDKVWKKIAQKMSADYQGMASNEIEIHSENVEARLVNPNLCFA